MRIGNIIRQTGRLALAVAVVAGVTLAVEKPAQAISGGEAAAIGLGSFAVRAGCGRSKPVQQRVLRARLRLPGGTGAGLLPGGTVLPAAQLLGSILPALLLVLSR
jgi:hypothetical protein